MKKKLSLSQIGLYNPQRISDSDVEDLFVVRTKLFDFLIDKLKKEKANSIPQHYLIIAQRGMGKTTMLKRIEVELRKADYNQQYIPLLFPEEQYNLKNLAEFWLNSLDALADTLEVEKLHQEVLKIDIKVKELEKIKNNEELAGEAFKFLKSFTSSLARRPILLIDNMNLIFDRLEKSEQHTLRALLMQNGAPVLIGASAVAIEDTSDYGAPFYDAFQIYYLKKLSFEELKEILINLAKLTQSEDVIPLIEKEVGRIKTLHQLTGGNPRTAVMLFRLIIKGFSTEINDDLEALLDEITPLYKARFEELSIQMQVIVDAIALHWDPINIEQLREASHYENSQLSPQLKRLVEVGWIEKIDAYQAKGKAYQISERFFNIWFLMRRSSRRQKKELYCLSKFLESFYGEEIPIVAQNRLKSKSTCIDHVTYSLALAEVVKDEKLCTQLREKSFNELKEFAKEDSDIFKKFDIPSEFLKEEIETRMNQIMLDNSNKNYQQARNLLNELVEMTSGNKTLNAQVIRMMGMNSVFIKDYPNAEEYLKKAIELNSNDSYSLFLLGFLYHHNLNKYKKSEEYYKQAISLDGKNASYWCNLGNLYQYDLKNNTNAEAAYQKAVLLDENNADYRNALGDLYLELEKYDEAEKIFMLAISIDNTKSEYFYKLGQLYHFRSGNLIEAEKQYKNAISLDQKNAIYWGYLGALYQFGLHRFEDAEIAYKQAVFFNPKYDLVWFSLGVLYQADLSKYEEAEKAYNQAIKLNGMDEDYFNALGNLYLDNLIDYKKAERSYKKALVINEKSLYPKLNLIFLYRDKLNRMNVAEELFNSIDDENDTNDSYWLNKSLFDLYKRNEGNANESFLNALSKIDSTLPENTRDDWWRFGAIVTKLGYGNWLLSIFEEKGLDIILSPYYVAIKALNVKDAEGYLNSKAIEIREPAMKLMEIMKYYM